MRKIPDSEKIIKEMADIAFGSEEKTSDRLRALDLLSELLHKKGEQDEAYEKLDFVLRSLCDIRED